MEDGCECGCNDGMIERFSSAFCAAHRSLLEVRQPEEWRYMRTRLALPAGSRPSFGRLRHLFSMQVDARVVACAVALRPWSTQPQQRSGTATRTTVEETARERPQDGSVTPFVVSDIATLLELAKASTSRRA